MNKIKYFKNKYLWIAASIALILLIFIGIKFFGYNQSKNLGFDADSRHFIVYGHGYRDTGEFLADTILIKSVFNDWEKDTKGSGADPLSYQLLNSYKGTCRKSFGRIACNEEAKKELESFNLPNYRLIILSREQFTTYSTYGVIYISAPKPLAFIPEEELTKLQKFIDDWFRKKRAGALE